MNKIMRTIFASIIFAGSLLGGQKAQAGVDSTNLNNANQSFVMQHAKEIASAQDQATNLSWHTSHYSHGSHGSHGSHYSHYSSRY